MVFPNWLIIWEGEINILEWSMLLFPTIVSLYQLIFEFSLQRDVLQDKIVASDASNHGEIACEPRYNIGSLSNLSLLCN